MSSLIESRLRNAVDRVLFGEMPTDGVYRNGAHYPGALCESCGETVAYPDEVVYCGEAAPLICHACDDARLGWSEVKRSLPPMWIRLLAKYIALILKWRRG